MKLKVKLLFTIFVHFLSGVHAEDNPTCRHIDFNKTDSLIQFEPCEDGKRLILKPYEVKGLAPSRADAKYFLTNGGPGISCISTTENFSLDVFTQFSGSIYLHSDAVGDTSSVQILVYDIDLRKHYAIDTFSVFNDRIDFTQHFHIPIKNAKIQIYADMTRDAVLAIEYLDFIDSEKDEEDCYDTETIESDDDNLSCLQIDFNEVDSINEIEACSLATNVAIKSYKDVAFPPFRDDVEYHLTNVNTEFACFVTKRFLNLDETTEFYAIIYLNSSLEGDYSAIQISVFDTMGYRQAFRRLTVFNEWREISHSFDRTLENAKIEITAIMSNNAELAIEYFRIGNSLNEDTECQRTTTTTTESIPTTTTTTDSIPITTTTEDPVDDNVNSLEIDFNNEDSINEFEKCSWTANVFFIKPYAGLAFLPFRPHVEYHLSNVNSGFTCFLTKRLLNLDETTEFYAIIYLNSSQENDPSNVQIKVFDTTTGNESVVETVRVSNGWTNISKSFDRTLENAKIEITATMTDTAELAIEYFQIETTATTTTISQSPINSSRNSVWMILSFSFIATTVIAIAVLIYIIFWYKSKLAKKHRTMEAPVIESPPILFPRLPVASGYRDVVGNERLQSRMKRL